MIPGGDIDYSTTVDNALAQYTTGLNQLVKVLAHDALSSLDDAKLISVMQHLEQQRNRIPLIDHAVIAEAQARNLPEALTQPSMIRVLMSVLRLIAGGVVPAGPGGGRGG